MSYQNRQNSQEERNRQKKIFRLRVYVAIFFTISLFLVLIGRMAYLQLTNFQHFYAMSDDNRISTIATTPTRGKIYDRNHVILAENKPVFVLSFIRNELEDIPKTLQAIKELLPNIPQSRLDSFYPRIRAFNRYRPLNLPYTLSEEEAAIFAVHNYKFPGVNLTSRLQRYYPFSNYAVHVLGYVGRINQAELATLDPKIYRGINVIGRLGIEQQYEDILRGKSGVQQIETNARGKIVRKLDKIPAIAGQDIQLTIDIRLQQFIENRLGDARGAVIVTVPNTGEILAFVSTPTYDPNLFIRGISHKDFNALLNDPNKPLVNRALSGQYPPASVIKPFIGLGALEKNIIPFYKQIFDPGYFLFKGHKFRNWKRTGFGYVDMERSIIVSCDTYFYQLGLRMGIDTIHDYLYPFGFGRRTGIDLRGEAVGILPSKQWKRDTKGKPWVKGQTIIAAIGQGYFLSTPLQMVKATSILANRGTVITPHLLKGKILAEEQIPIVSIRNWERIITSMDKVLTGREGTGRGDGARLNHEMAGKTGTAQVFSIPQGEVFDEENVKDRLRNHSLFVGFAPINRPEIAVVVIIENAHTRAVPIAVDIVNFYLDKKL